MADIIITPGSSLMSFTSSGNFTQTLAQEASGSLTLQGSGSTGRTDLFTVNGNNGTLFFVSDDLSNSLFSVNTIAGLPVIEAFADNTVVMGQYGQNVLVVTGSRVGIGTTSPASILNTSGSNQGITHDDSQTGKGYIRFRNNGTQLSLFGIAGSFEGSSLQDTMIAAETGLNIRFYTNGSATPKMFISGSGNVGIGTTTPAEKLDVNGKTKTTTLQVTSGSANGYVLTSDASGNGTWQAAASGGGGGLHIPTKPEVGRIYSLRMNGVTFNTSITAANGMRMLPFLPINTLIPSSFSINVSSASSGALIKILVFSDKEGYPFSKLYESTDLDCSTTGIKTSTSNALQFDAGNTYWVGIIANQSGPVLTGYLTNSVIPISELAVANVAQYLLGAINYPYNNVPSTVYPSEFSPASANAPAVFMST